MKIKSLTASFGKLDGDKLELKDGLNIIYAPNEAGKSTWCAFIRAMLYGINTSERDKAGFLSDKTKYLPWNGKNMEGTMDIRHGGYDITLQRTSLSGSPMKKFSALYSDILIPAEGLSADTAGETLTGASAKVFERTAFIRQSNVTVGADPGLEKRISSLISTGEEQTSYSESDARLRARLRKLRHNKNGSIPKLELELATEEDKLNRMDKLCDELASIHQEKEKYELRAKQLAEDLETYRKIEQQDLAVKIFSAKRRAVETGARVEELRNAITKNGLVMNADDLSDIAHAYSTYTLAEANAAKATSKKSEADEKLENIQQEKDASPFRSVSDTEALSKSQKATEIYEAKATLDKKIASIGQKLLIAVSIIMLIAAGYLIFTNISLYAGIACAVSALVFMVLFSIPLSKRKEVVGQLNTAISEFSLNSVEDMQKKSAEYADICRKLDLSKLECAAADKDAANLSDAADTAKASLLDKVHVFFPEIEYPEDIGPALSSLAEPMKAFPAAELDQAKALAEVSALSAAAPAAIADEQPEYIPVPPRTLSETKKAYSRTGDHITELVETDAMIRGELKALGDPVETTAYINNIKEEIDQQKEQYDALTLAIETLNDAHAELQTKFSPLVNEAASEIMHQLTSGRYEKLTFDKNFNALAKTNGEILSHNVLTLSAGTSDQIYLSLRLAMVQLLLSSGEPCPIILDDVFESFDNDRTENALKYLYGLSAEHQIILFTCHKREGEIMADFPDVNVISL